MWLVVLVGVVLIGAYYLEVFPDPYYHKTRVNIYTWLWREIDELIHGER